MPFDPITPAATYKTLKESIPLVRRAWQWYSSRKIPKAKRNTFGIAIAIATENEAHHPQIRNDFITTLRELVDKGDLHQWLSLIEIPQSRAAKIKSKPDAIRLLQKSESVFILWGLVRLRNVKNGGTSFVLDLHCEITRPNLTVSARDEVSREIAELIEGRRYISLSNDLEEFEVNAASVDLAARYIIALAAFRSRAYGIAQEFLANLREQVINWQSEESPRVAETLAILRERVQLNLAIVHIVQARLAYLKWRSTKDSHLLDEMIEHIEEVQRISPDYYDVWLLRAIYLFVKHRDVIGALKEIDRCKVIGGLGTAWIYFEAFLLAYRGDMIESRRIYLSLLHVPFESRIVLEAEQFIESVLDEEPDKIQLHFNLGIINHHAKGDDKQAEVHFRRFLSETEDGRFEQQRRITNMYLSTITHGTHSISGSFSIFG